MPGYQTPFDAQFTASMQRTPMFGGSSAPQLFNPMNLNVGGYPGMALQLLSPPLMNNMMGRHNMLPTQFMPTQNYYDQLQQQQFHRQQQMVMQQAARRDVGNIQQTIGGMMRMTTGRPLTLQQQQQAFQMANDVQGALPMMAQIFGPEAVDAIMGSRGSATIMAQAMHRGMRTTRDPITGRVGVGGRSAGNISREVYETLYGPGANLRQMAGISAGQAGTLFEELSMRGYVAPPSAYTPLEDRLGRMSRATFNDDQQRRFAESMLQARGQAVTPENMKAAREELVSSQKEVRRRIAAGDTDLAGMTELGGVNEMLSAGDAQRIAGRLKNMAGAVNAMRDIFGDMGRPNAPMREIINGLEALTQGGLATMSPGQVERMVRMTKNLASQSGLGVQGMMGLTAQGANMADRLGLDRSLAVNATQGTAAFSGAFRDTTRGDIPAFGALNVEEAALLDQQLRMQAQASFSGNAMGTLVRLEQEGFLDSGSEAAAAAAALRAGSRQYTWEGKTKAVPSSRRDFQMLMQRSGVDTNFSRSMLEDRYQNQQYIRDYGLGNLAREAQVEVDLRPRIGASFSPAIRSQMGEESRAALEAAGVIRGGVEGQGDFRRMTDSISQDVAKRFLELNPEVYKDVDKRNAAMRGAVRQSIINQVKAQGGTDADAAAFIEAMGGDEALDRAGASAMANLSTRIKYDPALQGYRSIVGMLQMHGGSTHDAQRARLAEAATVGEMQSAMSQFGRTSPIRRAVDVIQNAPAGQDISKTVAQMLGGVSADELAKEAPFTGFTGSMELFRQAERHRARKATQDEIDTEVARNRGMTLEELRKQEGDMAAFRAANAEEFTDAAGNVQRRIDARVGQLTETGIKQRNRASQVMRGLTIGGRRATDAIESIAADMGTDAAGVMKAIDAELARGDITDAERSWLTALRQSVVGLRAAEKGDTIPMFNKRLGLVDGQMVASGDIEGALEIAGLNKTISKDMSEKDAKAAVSNQQSFLDASRSMTESMMTSTSDMQQLGQGGTAMVQKQYKLESEIAQLAAEAGVTPAELLAGKGPEASVKKARKLRSQLVSGWEKINEIKKTNLMPGFGPRADAAAMGEHELDVARRMEEFITGKAFGPDAKQEGFDLQRAQAESVADALIDMTTSGTERKFRDSKALREQLVSQIGKGDRAIGMARALGAREEMIEMALKAGLVKRDGKALGAGDLDSLTGEERQAALDALGKHEMDPATKLEYQTLKQQSEMLAGLGRGDMGLDDLTKRIGQFSDADRTKLGKEAGEAAEKKTVKLVGRVRIENSEVLALSGDLVGDHEHNGMATNLVGAPSQSHA